MIGRNHRLIGVAAALAIATLNNNINGVDAEFAAITTMSALAGSTFPDIDIKMRNENTAKNSILFAGVLGSLYSNFWAKNTSQSLHLLILTTGLYLVVAFFQYIIRKNKRLSFYTEHRGITHTFIIPILLCILLFLRIVPANKMAFILGFVVGYVSHIFADALTVMGTPLLFPLSRKRFHLTKMTTGSCWEFAIANIAFFFSLFCFVQSFPAGQNVVKIILQRVGYF